MATLAILVTCPICSAVPGHFCTVVRKGNVIRPFALRSPHSARFKLAGQKRPVKFTL